MLRITTDDIPAADRFAHWREERGKAVFGVTIELDPASRNDFRASIAACPVGEASFVDMHVGHLEASYHVARTEADIARIPIDSLCIWRLVDGAGRLQSGHDDDLVLAGSLAIGYTDLPYANIAAPRQGFHCQFVKIPLAAHRHLSGKTDLVARPLGNEPGLNALLNSYFDAFVAQAPHLSGAKADLAIETLVQLALMARGDKRSPEDGRAAISEALLERARDRIKAHLHRADLSPALVAAMLGMSVRRLHQLFEPTGETFSRYVFAERLARARLMLVMQPAESIAHVGYHCGFDSLSTFHRGFRAAYGVSPGEFRHQRQRD
ncbi:helix-turn-helix transcriptional regulator [Phreatobacter stygius]|nr:AraC family transcriptional regulator [Phreatobacter stygius]